MQQMFRIAVLTVAMTLIGFDLANADDARCQKPPYGGNPAHFKAFIKDLGPLLDDPTKTLSAICNAKYANKNRGTLYKLGFTDSDINSKETSDLAAEFLAAVKNLADSRGRIDSFQPPR
jgi:hypothetical protein